MVFDKHWETVLKITDFFKNEEPVMLMGNTLWGLRALSDRKVFTDQNGIEYATDDGVLGAVAIELIENPEGEEHGTIVDAPRGLEVQYLNGVFHFDDIVINTNELESGSIDGGYDLDPDDDSFI